MLEITGESVYHLALNREQGAAYAIVTGDPGRVEGIAGRLEKPSFVAQNREFTTFAGMLKGKRVLVTSHGIGGPSAAICFEELALCGVRTLIRVGTCGGMAVEVTGGDLVVAQAAIRQEGTSLQYLPAEFPAVADFAVTAALARAAQNVGCRCHVGVVQCKDSFYGQHSPEALPVGPALLEKWRAWIEGGCLASEMETAALYTVAAVRRLRAGCVLQVLWNQERAAAGLPDPHVLSEEAAIDTAVEALRLLIADEAEGSLPAKFR